MKLGEALVQSGTVTQAQLDKAMAAQQAEPGKKLGELLVAQGACTAAQIDAALAAQ